MTLDKQAFYKAIRGKLFGSSLDQGEVDGCEAVVNAMEGAPLAYAAYACATAYHETNATMQPVREAYWLTEEWRKTHLRYWPFYGRGYVQLTWEANYERAGHELGLGDALLDNPDLAMVPTTAARIMRLGMTEGWFTGKSFASYLPANGAASLAAFVSARRIINGTDKAQLIASYASNFQDAFKAGGLT